jgi:hypothetical protein
MSEHYESESQSKVRQKFEREQAKMLGGLASVAPIVMIGGVIALAILILFTGLRAALILLKTFWLYPVVLVFAIFLSAFIKRKVPILKTMVGILVFVGVCVFGCMGVTSYYSNSKLFPSVYSADFIQALPDGKVPVLYEKMNNTGAVIAELSVGEKVTVNGVNLRRDNFNITTAEEKTGWVELAAFPEHSNEMLAISVGLDGIDSEEIAVDRQVELLMKKYLAVDSTLNRADVPTDYYKMSGDTLHRSTRVNAQTPYLSVERKEFRKGADLAETGFNLVLENILYADDCTVIHLSVTAPKGMLLAEGGILNLTAWQKALVAKDLDTGEEYPLMQGDYSRANNEEQIEGNRKSNVVYFFPPFKSRHFSLTHNSVSPLPDSEKKTGYGGILGLLSSLTGGDRASDYYFDWNFPEVRVR